jgi:hypothetical protein
MPLVGERASKYWLSAKPLWKRLVRWSGRRAAALLGLCPCSFKACVPGGRDLHRPLSRARRFLLQELFCWCLLADTGLEIRACASQTRSQTRPFKWLSRRDLGAGGHGLGRSADC